MYCSKLAILLVSALCTTYCILLLPQVARANLSMTTGVSPCHTKQMFYLYVIITPPVCLRRVKERHSAIVSYGGCQASQARMRIRDNSSRCPSGIVLLYELAFPKLKTQARKGATARLGCGGSLT